jgi:hypothetical protein
MLILRKVFILCSVFLLASCGGGESSSGGNADVTTPGDMLPANFVGTYTGILNLRASAAGLSQSESVPITITVSSNGTVTFTADDPDETVTVGISNAGAFSGNLSIEEDPCTGTISVAGSVDGANASGTVEGDGSCSQNGLNIDVELDGDFSATK